MLICLYIPNAPLGNVNNNYTQHDKFLSHKRRKKSYYIEAPIDPHNNDMHMKVRESI